METTPKPGPSMSMKVGAGLIIAIMLFSGAAVFFASQSNTDTTDPNTDTNPTLVTYLAEEVNGKVTQIFPSVIVTGSTTSSDKSVIDEELAKLPGVSKLESQFTKLDSTSSQLTYLANVQLKSLDDKEAFLDALSTITTISNPEVYFQASVQVPAKLTGKSQTNETKEFTLPQTTIQAIILPPTETNNNIIGTVSATFSGEQLASVYIIEFQNLSLTPISISTYGTYTIADLQKYSVTGRWSYIPDFNVTKMKNDLKKIDGVLEVDDPIVPYIDNLLTLTFSDANEYVDDVNKYAQLHQEQFTSVSSFGNTLNIELGTISLEEAKVELSKVINESAATNVQIAFGDPITPFLVDLNVSLSNSTTIEKALQSYFNSFDSNFEIYQNGSISLESIQSSDSNAIYQIDGGLVPVAVKPGHTKGDQIHMQIVGTVVNGKISSIEGSEIDAIQTNDTNTSA